jgi:nucleotide-binding universal stress UspA family protein
MTSFNRILCPVDLAQNRDVALKYAVALTRAYNATLFLFFCNTSTDGHIRELVENGMEADDLFSDYLAPYTQDIDWKGWMVNGSNPALSITDAAHDLRADLIIMSSRRRPTMAAILGSTAEQVTKNAPCPVLVTHPDEREWVEDEQIKLKRIAVAHDFHPYSELSLDYALSIEQEYRSEIHLLHVIPNVMAEPEISWNPACTHEVLERTARKLSKLADNEKSHNRLIRTSVREGKPSKEILDYSERHQIELIVMGSQSCKGDNAGFFGSTTDKVLRHAPCPVLIVRPLQYEVQSEAASG